LGKGSPVKARILGIALIVVSVSMLLTSANVPSVKANLGTIVIGSGGYIFPSTAPIHTSDNITYFFTDDVIDHPIYVKGDNITIDGQGHVLQGAGWNDYENGITLALKCQNVTIKNFQIKSFYIGINVGPVIEPGVRISGNNITGNQYGIWLMDSHLVSVNGNNIVNNNDGIYYDQSCKYNTASGNNIAANNIYGILGENDFKYNAINGNNITANGKAGIWLFDSYYNVIKGNNIATNYIGIHLAKSYNNNVRENIIKANNATGIDLVLLSSNNIFYHNSFLDDNATFGQVRTDPTIRGNLWNKNPPRAGNYWSDYKTKYPEATEIDSSGIWNTPCIIDANNTDHYPLVRSNEPLLPEFPPFLAVTPSFVQKFTNTTHVGDTFSVSLAFGNVTNLAGFQYTLYWNKSLLNVISIRDSMPWLSSYVAKNITDNNFNATFGRTYFVVTEEGYYGSINGSATFRTMTFKIMSLPANGNFSSVLAWGPYGNYGETLLGDRDDNIIPAITFNGEFVLTYSPRIIGDVNDDRTISILDLILVSKAFSTFPGDPNYNLAADINLDGKINILDMILVSTHLGQHSP
jgi:parallel beta-helix repeat protein